MMAAGVSDACERASCKLWSLIAVLGDRKSYLELAMLFDLYKDLTFTYYIQSQQIKPNFSVASMPYLLLISSSITRSISYFADLIK
jgi:hypothetical protein